MVQITSIVLSILAASAAVQASHVKNPLPAIGHVIEGVGNVAMQAAGAASQVAQGISTVKSLSARAGIVGAASKKHHPIVEHSLSLVIDGQAKVTKTNKGHLVQGAAVVNNVKQLEAESTSVKPGEPRVHEYTYEIHSPTEVEIFTAPDGVIKVLEEHATKGAQAGLKGANQKSETKGAQAGPKGANQKTETKKVGVKAT